MKCFFLSRLILNNLKSHNRAPMPFNKDVGNTITYQAAKPENWQPGDYTKFAPAPKNR